MSAAVIARQLCWASRGSMVRANSGAMHRYFPASLCCLLRWIINQDFF